MNADLLAEATFVAWREFVRHTPRRIVNGREESVEDAHRRRFAGLQPHVVEQFEREAKAVLRLVEYDHAA